MYAVFTQIARLFPAAQGAAENNGVAHQLLERAEARAGSNPHQAQELRDAARAYLSVIR
ncbi:MAG: hypothetical protein HYX47_05190 [Burkholderiales bacterium]|nr:hypothetical protein [Burkholderiales bacterium]